MALNVVPAPASTGALSRLQEAVEMGIAPALAIMLDDALFAQVQKIALIMSKADGFVPKHCVGRTEVCFAIVTRALVWKLDPFACAQSTYQPVEGAKVSYEGKLVQAILEQSGRLDGPITREYREDWSKVQGQFRMQKSEKGKMYAVQAWPEEAERGLGVTVSALLKGEKERRHIDLDLRQCHPRNSTLWATDPVTQIYYRAVRMLGNVAMPGVLMGVPFVGEEDDDDDSRSRRARNVTPVDFAARASAPPVEDVSVVDPDGEELALLPGEVDATVARWCSECTDEQLDQLIDNNREVSSVMDAVEAERLRRSNAKPTIDTADPLNLAGIKGAMGFLSTLRMGIEQADATDADRYWECYRERAKAADAKINAGDYAAIEAIVAEKIKAVHG